jgi:CheY-like chemotaxis protein
MAIILIVDDEEMERLVGKAILEPAGHELRFAKDGEAALRVCEKGEVDLLLTDLAMPGFSGLRLIKELRLEGLDLPIVAVSGWAADQLDLAQDYGADVTLSKPVDPQELLAAIADLLSGPGEPPPVDLFSKTRF